MATMTRKHLKAVGLTEEQIDAVMELHTDVVNEIKSERDSYKTEAEKVDALTKERDDAAKKLEALSNDGNKAAEIQKAFDDYKGKIEAEKTTAIKGKLVREALTAKKANAQAVELLMRGIDLDKVELDGDKLKDVDGILNPVIEQYSGFFGTDSIKGTGKVDPPAGGGSSVTRESIMAIKDRDERRAAIAEHIDLFNN